MELNNKLKKELNEKLSSFIGKTYDKDNFIDLNLLETMVEVSNSVGYEVAVLINRKGKVINIFVGEKNNVSITDELGVGVRLVHTHPNASSTLSELDKSLLKNNSLDCVCAISIKNNCVYNAQAGFMLEDNIELVNIPNGLYINKYGLMEKIHENAVLNKAHNSKVSDNDSRVILVMAEINKGDNAERDLEEMENLANTAHLNIVGKLSQKRSKPDPKFVIGEGKLKELQNLIQITNANMVIFDNELTGNRINNLENALGVKVINRSMLILDIFAMRAKSNEGKLQVELAQLKYSLPRLGSLSSTAGRFGGGVGMRGPGETQIELNKRIVERNIIKVEKELHSVKKQRNISRLNRRKSNKTVVAIVGYTNSGKSTLMNLLSNANVYAKNELFATLDTTTRNVWLEDKKEILLIDTVGFINKLPTEFIEAFSSTLEETVFADLILHVVDASDINYERNVSVVLELLTKLGVTSPLITVYNKIDKIEDREQIENLKGKDKVCISAKNNINIDKLKSMLKNFLEKNI